MLTFSHILIQMWCFCPKSTRDENVTELFVLFAWFNKSILHILSRLWKFVHIDIVLSLQ